MEDRATAATEAEDTRLSLHPPLGKTTNELLSGRKWRPKRSSPPSSCPSVGVAGLRRGQGGRVKVLRKRSEHWSPAPAFARGTFGASPRANPGAPERTSADDLGGGREERAEEPWLLWLPFAVVRGGESLRAS